MSLSSSSPLFSLPIPVISGQEKEPNGTIVCTQIESTFGPIYLLTITSPSQNRLSAPFLQTFLLALDILEFAYPHGVVVTTSGISKFYSNGLDLQSAQETPRFFQDHLFAVFRRMLTYPMPTIAMINGHAFAAGCMLAIHHDYRIMIPSHGYICLNELEIGAQLLSAMSSIFRQKLRPDVYKIMVLEARRFSASQALKAGIIDAVGNFPEVLAMIDERKLAVKHSTGVYGLLRAEMYRETLTLIDSYEDELQKNEQLLNVNKEREEIERRRFEEWQINSAQKAKL